MRAERRSLEAGPGDVDYRGYFDTEALGVVGARDRRAIDWHACIAPPGHKKVVDFNDRTVAGMRG